jgi:hypothetical protein
MAVRADVHVVEKDFAVLDAGKAVAQVHASFTNRLDFGAEQHEAGLERLQEMEIMEGLAVLGNAALRFFPLGLVSHRPAYAARASLAASSTAATMLSGSAMPLPAMSNAVP